MPDAAAYGDPPGGDTLGNIARLRGLHLPNLARLGLGNIKPLAGIAPAEQPAGRLRPLRAGFARQGHDHRPLGNGRHPSREAVPALSRTASRRRSWSEFERRIGRCALGNKAASGTEIIQELGAGAHAHRLAHRLHFGRQRVPGGRARRSDPAVGAVQDLRDRARDSARPARSGPRDRAAVHRLARRISRAPPTATITPCRRPRACCSTGWRSAASPVHSVGKIFDVFLGRGIGESDKTKNNADGMAKTLEAMRETAKPA